MFEFTIITNEREYDYESRTSTRVSFKGTACGTIEDHLEVAEKVDGFLKIGNIIVPSHKVLAIEVKAVQE